MVNPFRNTSSQISPTPGPVPGSGSVEFDAPAGESPVVLVTMETSPRKLTRSQGELVRGAWQHVDPMTVRRRVVGKRTIIPPNPLA